MLFLCRYSRKTIDWLLILLNLFVFNEKLFAAWRLLHPFAPPISHLRTIHQSSSPSLLTHCQLCCCHSLDVKVLLSRLDMWCERIQAQKKRQIYSDKSLETHSCFFLPFFFHSHVRNVKPQITLPDSYMDYLYIVPSTQVLSLLVLHPESRRFRSIWQRSRPVHNNTNQL